MQMSGERTIAADRAAVWSALNDPEVLKACIPGCQEMTKTSDTTFEAKVAQKVGPVRATFAGEVELTDIVAGESYRIDGKGKGGAAGGASGGAAVRLKDVAEGTKLSYDVDAKVTGKLAQLGGRLIDGFAKKFADDFFDRFKAQIEGPDAADAAVAAAGDDAPGAPLGSADAGGPSHEIPRSDDEPQGAPRTPPVAGRSAARAHDAAAKTVEDEMTGPDEADPAKKKGLWGRLFG
ncbi:MAG TPA: carbon monoxide dehydrogenase subunit G [Paracoccaceae bacterium]|nr:carbon monoxide dehydrogenase subunit G [Paracoccaceae bacterium]